MSCSNATFCLSIVTASPAEGLTGTIAQRLDHNFAWIDNAAILQAITVPYCPQLIAFLKAF